MSEENQAIATLGDAGMLPAQDDDEKYYEADSLFSGRPDAVRFDAIGDSVTGRVVEVFTRQRTKFGTNDPEFWDDGSPKLEPVIVLLTSDGLRTLYVGSWRMRKAMGEAFNEAGVRGPRPGGELHVRFSELEAGAKGQQPAKCFEVAYDPPGKAPAGRVAVPPAQPGQRLISAECAGGDHVNCIDRRCTDECHGVAPEAVRQHSAISSGGEPPF